MNNCFTEIHKGKEEESPAESFLERDTIIAY